MLAAALLHDVGKAQGRVPFWTRSAIVLGKKLAPQLLSRLVIYPDREAPPQSVGAGEDEEWRGDPCGRPHPLSRGRPQGSPPRTTLPPPLRNEATSKGRAQKTTLVKEEEETPASSTSGEREPVFNGHHLPTIPKWRQSLSNAWYHAEIGADLAYAAGLSGRAVLYIRTHHQPGGPAAELHEVDEVS